MKVTEIAFVGMPVSDMDRARDFYGNVLGLTATMDHEIGGHDGVYWVEYEIGEGTLAISNAWEPSGQNGPTVALEVEDFDATMAHLKEAGVTIHADLIESPVCCFALIADPDGNSITIHKRTHDATPECG